MALDLGKQVGPMPLGAWLAVVAGGLGIAYYTKGSSGEPEIEYVEDLSMEEGVGEGPGWTAIVPPTNPPIVGTPEDNDEWGRLAIDRLIADGYDPGWTNSAITKALAGRRLSVREWSIWKMAVMKYGSPPFPIEVDPPSSSPKPNTPKPKPPNKPKPKPHVTGRWFVVKAAPLPGSNLRGIAKLVYGDANEWRRIYQANRKGKDLPRDHRGKGKPRRRKGKIENPNVLRPGWVLYIPRG